jgi:hypothetical protein
MGYQDTMPHDGFLVMPTPGISLQRCSGRAVRLVLPALGGEIEASEVRAEPHQLLPDTLLWVAVLPVPLRTNST